ncbi:MULTISPECIES: ClpXP protease specificity-enhancing factor [Cupriavidus]|uniref:ClpXP protease specificity-enhancing factor n=1 Tax=Cupriavidus basilensis TaxID=68895 RepID=A0A643FZN8_9BURK|nr:MULTISPECIES: ClpXP protease specificity-enhancing factor [Cupriavidus]MBB1632894.1 ClpXP protease specificity-enhancing factor [Cupriavidus sp. UME77]MCY0856712.1 ClpXP protease specificity-enhancing factor [Cupriavidus sp. D39]MDW3680851.1 ClpXP protease specificity-enhancing factor [Cupriavidus sp. CV2]QOT76116.1 ClpXP protease specificity-enhancing factor [Cupriavidus basilensis]
MPETSTKPYLIRAIYEWCTDNGFTPYIAVFVDANTSVPREFVKNNEIVLNVSFDATSGLDMGNEWIGFSARFGGISRKIDVPIENVLAIYARENGQGMAFPVERSVPETQAATERENNPPPKLSSVESEPLVTAEANEDHNGDDEPTPPPVSRIGAKKPSLKVVK